MKKQSALNRLGQLKELAEAEQGLNEDTTYALAIIGVLLEYINDADIEQAVDEASIRLP